MNEQSNIFEMLYPKYKITKKIRIIEMFGGYGSQSLSLKRLGVDFEHWKLCEWAVKSIQAYKDIHMTNVNIDFSEGYSKEALIDWLYEKGISSNYNEPMAKKQIERLNEKQLRTIFNNIQITNNLVNIQQVKAKDLEIDDKDNYEYIFTYSFPCQDLSNAGKKKGMSDTSTRSGMLWEVERILTECKELDCLPQILLMENVPQVHGVENVKDFNKWQLRLEELGYKNYWQDLIATDYGIPQTRNRCFMVSLQGDYSYTFPNPIPLKLKLKDMLEDNVDEKYYLSDKMLSYIVSEDDKYKVSKGNLKINRNLACSKTTREGNTRADTSDYISNKIDEEINISDYDKVIRKYGLFDTDENKRQAGSIYDENGVSPTLDTMQGGYRQPMIEEKNITRNACDNLIKQNQVKENDVIITSHISRRIEEDDLIVNNNISATLTTAVGHEIGVVIKDKPKVLCGVGEKDSNNNTQWKQQNRVYDDNVAITITTCCNPYYKNDLRIRKLTPKECGRLMGVSDEDIDKITLSDSAKYHIFGDSIVVDVLCAIFKEMI